MTENDILKFRLTNHLITKGKPDNPEKVVSWMGAIQGQDYGQAKYAIGCRMSDAKDRDIEKAITDKKLVRTWALRGTLHVVAAADIHWLLPLVTPVIITRCQPQFKRLELGDKEFTKIHHCIVQLLQDDRQLTRKELFEGLEQKNISTAGLRGVYILYKAGWQGLICLGPLKGKQDTYTLLEEWVPDVKKITKEQALAELARRYFQSHGPATLNDFILWSGLRISEGRSGFEQIRDTLTQIEVNDQLYWMAGNGSATDKFGNNTYFLPGFDEYLIGYKDRALMLNAADTKKVILKNGIFKPVIIKNGKITGTWNRVIHKNKLTIATALFGDSDNSKMQLAEAIEKYRLFMTED
jgi:hypothetical protein